MHRRIVTAAALSVMCSVALAVDVKFWPSKLPAPSGAVVEDQPCGPVIALETDVVPNDVPCIEPDHVREIDAGGNSLREWRVPIDHYPVALEGDTLVMAFGSSLTSVLKVTLDGKLSKESRQQNSLLVRASCPSQIDESYACVILSESPKRYLAYPMVCT